MDGWILLHRKLLRWTWFTSPETLQVFIYFLLRANHEVINWQGIDIQRGQFVTSVNHIKDETGLTISKIRTCINRLKSTNEVTSETTNRFTIITICNYENYQMFDESERQTKRQSKQQSNDNQIATNNKDNKDNNRERGKFTPPTLSEVEKYFNEKGYTEESAKRAYDYYSVANWKDSRGKSVKNWKQKMLSVWLKPENKKTNQNEKKYIY